MQLSDDADQHSHCNRCGAGHGLRAKEVREMLGIGTESQHTESARAKLKRLVDRDILAEPGLFALTHPAPATPDTNSSLKSCGPSQKTRSVPPPATGSEACGSR